MDFRVAELGNGVQMILRRVTFVPIEAVAGVLGVQFEHQAVPRDLGDNRCRGNGLYTANPRE